MNLNNRMQMNVFNPINIAEKSADSLLHTTHGKSDNPASHAVSEDQVRQIFGPDTVVHVRDPKECGRPPWVDPAEDKLLFVECGPKSKGLCALAFRDEQVLHHFLDANPALAGTLITHSASKPFRHRVWLRLAGWCPRSACISSPLVQWVSDLEVYVPTVGLTLPSPEPAILTTTFDAVHWPEQLEKGFLYEEAVADLIPFAWDVLLRQSVIKSHAFDLLYCLYKNLIFDPSNETFYGRNRNPDALVPLSNIQVASSVNRCLYGASENVIVKELRLPQIKILSNRLKKMMARAGTP